MKFFGSLRLKFIHGKSLNSSFVHKIFGCPNFFESLEGSPQVFWHCETKTIDRIVITLLSKTFWYQNSSETQNGSPTMIFGDVRQKKLDKIVIPLLSRRLLMPEHFWNTERFAHDVFRRFWTNKSRRKMWHPFFSIIFFPYWKVSQTQKRSPWSFSVVWD